MNYDDCEDQIVEAARMIQPALQSAVQRFSPEVIFFTIIDLSVALAIRYLGKSREDYLAAAEASFDQASKALS